MSTLALSPGSRFGPYEILSPLGAGGMGEVYRARDTRLDRTVAIKVLPAHLSSSEELRQRFEREAKTISQLSHPHICALYDVGHQDGTDYLVMEFLEGETLTERLAKGPLPVEQVLRYGIEMADALDKAHRQGVIHRDLKPGNIMLTKSGVKLVDFGLAKFTAPVAARLSSATALPTQAPDLTAEGTILGTFQYMAPEQLEGKEADARSDIFAFGAVLHEMATGQKAFSGKSQASLIGAILRDDPVSISEIAPMTPPALNRVVKTCLAKDPDDRFQTAHDVMLELKWIAEGSQAALAAARLGARRGPVWIFTAALLSATAFAGFLGWRLGTGRTPPRLVSRFSLPLTSPLAVQEPWWRPAVALSPDGRSLVYAAQRTGDTQLYLRRLDQLESTPLPGTEGGSGPFFSPDGQWVGFFAGGKLLKVPIAGGAPVTVCEAASGRGASWGSDDTIVFAGSLYGGLSRVPASGGTPRPLTVLDPKKGERSHRWPEILPGGKAVLFAVGVGGSWDEARIVAQSLDTGDRRILVEGGSQPRYVPAGYIVYGRAGSLLAVPFDRHRLKVTGSPFQVVERVATEESGAVEFTFSADGSLVYVPTLGPASDQAFVWVNRQGNARPVSEERRPYRQARLSPDGRRIAFLLRNEIWTYELARGVFTRLTSGIRCLWPIWTPDGRRITFASEKHGPWNIFWRNADGTGEEERLLASDAAQVPLCWSPDGKVLALLNTDPASGPDIWLYSPEDRKARPFLKTPFREFEDARFSPDGRYLAYSSDESGRREVYVRPFPGAGGKWQISTEGGGDPVWSPKGRELFYRNGEKMMAVSISPEPSFQPGPPQLLFQGRYTAGFDISPDAEKFLMIKESEEAAREAKLHLVLNWFEDLKRRRPSAKSE